MIEKEVKRCFEDDEKRRSWNFCRLLSLPSGFSSSPDFVNSVVSLVVFVFINVWEI
jgi:hypothetical protein